jgi:hypothetical protein
MADRMRVPSLLAFIGNAQEPNIPLRDHNRREPGSPGANSLGVTICGPERSPPLQYYLRRMQDRFRAQLDRALSPR